MGGIFITFEGIDGSGKSTQINLLNDYLLKKGYNVLLTREPGGTSLGDTIRDMLLNPANKGMSARAETMLFLASRAELVEKVIAPALKSGKVVICDRFFDSTIVYQGIARSLGVEKMLEMSLWATSGIKPHLTFLLSVNIDACESRMVLDIKVPDRIENEKRDFKQKIQEGYLKIARQNKNRFIVIDGDMAINSIFITVKKHVDRLIKLKKIDN
ncbi:MAG: dTMP kinase [Actinobacteria bacterium]|nr:dTMP kinase [Actinomycetota bacterium]